MSSFDFDILSDEHRRLRIGPHLHGLIWEVVSQRVAGRELILGEAADVFQAFVLEDLLASDASQLTWIFTTATSSSDVAKMLHHRCERFLVSTKKRSVRDNLWHRSQPILARPPFKTVNISSTGSRARYCLDGVTQEDLQVTPGRIRIAAILARSVQTLRSTATERNPKVYDEGGLTAVLKIFLAEVGGPASNRDLDDFLRQILTPWEEPSLVTDVESNQIVESANHAPLIPEDQRIVSETLAEIDAALSEEEREIVLMKILGASDGDVAERHSISRPTAAKRRDQAYAVIRGSMAGLDAQISAHVLDRLVSILENRGPA